MPEFRPQDGWLGGDAAYSIPLPGRRSLWLFGDTFVSSRAARSRAGASLVANSVGVSGCRGGRWSIRYHWDPGPEAVFPSTEPGARYWPMAGVLAGGRVYLGLLRVVGAGGTDPFSFRLAGSQLAVLDNPSEPPARWRVERRAWRRDGVVPAAAGLVHDGYAYFFAALDRPSHPVVLTRIPLAALERARPGWQHWGRRGAWETGDDLDDAAVLFDPGQTEFSVAYHPDRRRWVAILADQGFPSPGVVFREAARLEGPWGPQRPLLRFPPAKAGSGRFCYAAKEHPEFDGPDALITYACNSSRLAEVLGDPDLYFPVAVSVRLPAP